MIGNKFTQADKTVMLTKKLDLMSQNLQSSITAGTYQTQEEYVFEAIRVLNTYYNQLLTPQMPSTLVLPDQLLDTDDFNLIWNKLLQDLIIIFSELENVEGLTLANFNTVTTDVNRLTTRLKTISSKLGDYILYVSNPKKDAFFFTDSFNNLSKVDSGSPLLNNTECEVDQEEGILKLPIDNTQTSTISVTEAPIINSNSNGTLGNNVAAGALPHSTIMDILDGNPDTWVEYELVTETSVVIPSPLVLDFTINLGTPTIVNYIRINPNNFGVRTVVTIHDIQTSPDGHVYTSIKKDIPILGFDTGKEDTTFTLAPAASKYAGQGVYSFNPRQVKYVHIILSQSEPYVITDTNGKDWLRYAIGIRDVEIRGIQYLNVGELVTTQFTLLDEIRKVAITTNQIPVSASELANLEYYISADNGNSWLAIQPQQINAVPGVEVTVPEILDFNGYIAGTIETPTPVNGIRLKIKLTRNDDAFTNGSTSLAQNVLSIAEPHQLPTDHPFVIELGYPPIDKSIQLIDPLYGSRGIPSVPYYIGQSANIGNSRVFNVYIPDSAWPLDKFSNGATPPIYYTAPVTADTWIDLKVGGSLWTQATVALSAHSSKSTVYNLVKTNENNMWQLQFGDGGIAVENYGGAYPSSSDQISIDFIPERIFPTEASDNHLAGLTAATSNNKDDITIERYEDLAFASDVAPFNTKVIQLSHQNIVGLASITTALSVAHFTTQQTFMNGVDELITAASWSIDTVNGIIYLAAATSPVDTLNLQYSYQPITKLTRTDWEWGSNGPTVNSLIIKDTGWQTREVTQEPLGFTSNGYAIDLSKLNITKGTLQLNALVADTDVTASVHPFLLEVPFIDGRTEHGSKKQQITEPLPSFNKVGLTNPVSFVLKHIPTADTTYGFKFTSDTVFTTLVGGTPAAPGQYSVNRTNGQVTVYLPTTTPVVKTNLTSGTAITKYVLGSVLYTYDSADIASSVGQYSVDYQHGVVYTQRPLLPSFSILASYEYTDYRVKYKIARVVPPENYSVDIVNQAISIKDSEALRRPIKTSVNGESTYYIVNYNYVNTSVEGIEKIGPYFTPVLKDYVIKLVTKGQLV